MHWLKAGAIVLLVLAAMRLASWAAGWLLDRVAHPGRKSLALIANTLAFAAFVALLGWNLLPGEPMDWAAVAFAVVVFTVCGVADLYWKPWRRRFDNRRTHPLD